MNNMCFSDMRSEIYGTFDSTDFGISPSILNTAKLFRRSLKVDLLLTALVGFVVPGEIGTNLDGFEEHGLFEFLVVETLVGISSEGLCFVFFDPLTPRVPFLASRVRLKKENFLECCCCVEGYCLHC